MAMWGRHRGRSFLLALAVPAVWAASLGASTGAFAAGAYAVSPGDWVAAGYDFQMSTHAVNNAQFYFQKAVMTVVLGCSSSSGNDSKKIDVVGAYSVPYPAAIREALLAVSNTIAHTATISRLNFLVGELYAAVFGEEWQLKEVDERLADLGLEQANVSQHLAVLRAKGLVVNRKEGTQVFYALRDPLLSEVLANMRQYFQAHIEEALRILKEI